jgi:hypothetical protein
MAIGLSIVVSLAALGALAPSWRCARNRLAADERAGAAPS